MICKTWKRFVQFVGQMYHLSCITIICQTNRGANCEGKVVDLLKGNHLTSETRGDADLESRSRSSEALNLFLVWILKMSGRPRAPGDRRSSISFNKLWKKNYSM